MSPCFAAMVVLVDQRHLQLHVALRIGAGGGEPVERALQLRFDAVGERQPGFGERCVDVH